jgi:hypothetical protein
MSEFLPEDCERRADEDRLAWKYADDYFHDSAVNNVFLSPGGWGSGTVAITDSDSDARLSDQDDGIVIALSEEPSIVAKSYISHLQDTPTAFKNFEVFPELDALEDLQDLRAGHESSKSGGVYAALDQHPSLLRRESGNAVRRPGFAGGMSRIENDFFQVTSGDFGSRVASRSASMASLVAEGKVPHQHFTGENEGEGTGEDEGEEHSEGKGDWEEEMDDLMDDF